MATVKGGSILTTVVPPPTSGLDLEPHSDAAGDLSDETVATDQVEQEKEETNLKVPSCFKSLHFFLCVFFRFIAPY
jgi:hypothetical protein